MTCLRGAFLDHALAVQRAQGEGAITTVRMLEREQDNHIFGSPIDDGCDECCDRFTRGEIPVGEER